MRYPEPADLKIPEDIGTVKINWNHHALGILLAVAEEHYPPGGECLREDIEAAIRRAKKKAHKHDCGCER